MEQPLGSQVQIGCKNYNPPASRTGWIVIAPLSYDISIPAGGM
jgi:hypothetical protein